MAKHPPPAGGTLFRKEGGGSLPLVLALFSKEGGSAEPGVSLSAPVRLSGHAGTVGHPVGAMRYSDGAISGITLEEHK